MGLSAALTLEGQTTGAIAGRVTDAQTKLALSSVQVSVVGTALTTFADQSGDYLLANVPAGAATLEFSYVGYADLRKTAHVAAGATTSLNAAFGTEVVTLDRFVITGSAVGSARAINQQRAADTLSNIIASDEIGRFPDQNVAESMQRIPGLALYRDQGEGRFIVVRGIRPDLNSVKLNGVSMASPERGDRVVALDVLPTDALAAVEVTKVPTPDQDADGLGGSINVRTRSAFDAEGRQLQFSAQGQFNNLTERLSSKFNGTYAERFNDGKVGFIFSPTWQARRFGSNNFEEDGGYTLRPVPGSTTGQQAYFLNGLAFRDYEITRTRYGASSALEFKPDYESLYYVRSTFSQFNDHEIRYVYTLPFIEGTLSALSDTGATVTAMRRERYDMRYRKKDQRLFSVVAGGEKTIGAWKFDGRAAWSKGEEERPDETTARFRKSTRTSNWTYSFANGTYAPSVSVTGANVADPSLCNEISRFRLVNSPGDETEINLGLNARHALKLGDLPAYVKVGSQLRQKEKNASNETVDHTAPASFMFANLLEGQTPSDYPFYSNGTRASTPKILAAFRSNSAAFTPTRLFAESTQDDWQSTEDVTALYAMGGATWGRLNVLGGLRYERTEYENRGNQVSGPIASAVRRGRSYDNYLPGVHYPLQPRQADRPARLLEQFPRTSVLRRQRAAPQRRSGHQPRHRGQPAPQAAGSGAGTVSAGAAAGAAVAAPAGRSLLISFITSSVMSKAGSAWNWDASMERYLPSLGLLSAAVFHKDIENFTYQRTLPGGDPATGYTLVTFVNGNKGHIRGLELSWQQQLRSLPAPFNGLGFMANYTRSESEATYPTRPGEKLDFIGQSKEIGNLALTFERGGFFLRAALNFRTPRLREDEPLGFDAPSDRWVDDFKQFDVTAAYRLNRNWEVFAEALNLTNEPFRVYFGKNGTRLVQFEEYGWSANFGVRWKL